MAGCAWVELALFCGADCWAEACCTETKSTAVAASKKNRTIRRFTAILPSEFPVRLLNHRLQRKSPGNAFQPRSNINPREPAVIAGLFANCWERTTEAFSEADEMALVTNRRT